MRVNDYGCVPERDMPGVNGHLASICIICRVTGDVSFFMFSRVVFLQSFRYR